MGQVRLLHELEKFYSGLAAEYSEDAGRGGPFDDVGESDSGPHQEAHFRLRCADTVPALFGYQRELVEAVKGVCCSVRGKNVGLLALPTGAGKTRTAAVALLELLTSGRTRSVLWLAPTRELLEQAVTTLHSVWLADRRAVDVDLVRADLVTHFPEKIDRVVLFATPQMVAARLKRGIVPEADIVVFDEAHHVEAPVFRQAIEQVRQKRNTAIIGLSATPGRVTEEETERLIDFFDSRLLRSEQLGRDPIGVLQRRGVLARVAFKKVPLERTGRRQTKEGAMRTMSSDVVRFRAVVCLADGLAKKARVLIFAASVDYAKLVAAALRCQGVSAEAVSSRDGEEVRRRRLRAFERGEVAVIVNKQLLATGYDCPAVRHVILAARIGSPILFEQIVGRASRGPRVGGHARATVWEFEDHLAAHGLPQSYYRYSDYDWDRLGG